MPAYTLTPVRTADFTGANGTNIETLVSWLDAFPSTSGGYYAVVDNKCKLEFAANELNALADVTGSYTNNQYVSGRVGDLSAAGGTARYLGGLLHCTGASAAGTTANYYRLEISQDSQTVPLVTRVMRVTSGTAVQIATSQAVTWGNGDRFLLVDHDGIIEVYRDSGGGFGSTAVLSVDDTASRLTGGGPGVIIRVPDVHTLDDVEFGDATVAAAATLTGSITLDVVDPTGSLGLNPSSITGSITLDAIAPTGTLGIAPGQVTTLPFSRNTGSRPTGLSGVALAVLSDDANLTRLAGATSLSQDGSGRITYTGAGLPSVGTSVLVVTREPDGKLGIERYTVG